jgi:hypothetical protein
MHTGKSKESHSIHSTIKQLIEERASTQIIHAPQIERGINVKVFYMHYVPKSVIHVSNFYLSRTSFPKIVRGDLNFYLSPIRSPKLFMLI